MGVYLMVAAAAVFAACFVLFQSEEAPAAPIVGSGSFTLAPQQEQVVFNEAVPMHVGVTIKSNLGDVSVEKFDGANWVSLGTVGSGSACVFEGDLPGPCSSPHATRGQDRILPASSSVDGYDARPMRRSEGPSWTGRRDRSARWHGSRGRSPS